MGILDVLKTDIEAVEAFQNNVISKASGGFPDDDDYRELRDYLVNNPLIRPLLPGFAVTNRDSFQFWQFIKSKFTTYAKRRDYIYNEFKPLLDKLEGIDPAPGVNSPIQEFNTLNFEENVPESSENVPEPPVKVQPENIDWIEKSNKIFIVHGHDDLAKEQVARFISQIGLEPIILHEQASSGKTIIEKIESFSDVGFAVVLYTPCDIGSKKVNNSGLKERARQNVVFEHGYFVGTLGRKNVTAFVKGDIEKPNDISGVVYIDFDERGAWKMEFAKELKSAGYKIDMNKIFP